MTIYLPEIDTDSYQFPHPSDALEEPNGLLAMGGDLSPLRLHNAYREGIFPWFSEGRSAAMVEPNTSRYI